MQESSQAKPNKEPEKVAEYSPAKHPRNEEARQQALDQYRILDTEGEQWYDDLTLLASMICGTPVALLSLMDNDRQWFKSRIGVEQQSTPRDWSFCAHAILEPDKILEVPNALQDSRFAGNPFVQGDFKLRFYAGVPLLSPSGHAIGTICVIDQKPRTLTEDQRGALRCLARQAVAQMVLRQTIDHLEQQSAIRPTG